MLLQGGNDWTIVALHMMGSLCCASLYHGFAVVVVGCFRDHAAAAASGRAPPEREDHDPNARPFYITVKTAVALLVMASVVLLTLFFLIKMGVSVVMIITAMFCFGAVSAVTVLVTQPVLIRMLPGWKNRTIPVCGHSVRLSACARVCMWLCALPTCRLVI